MSHLNVFRAFFPWMESATKTVSRGFLVGLLVCSVAHSAFGAEQERRDSLIRQAVSEGYLAARAARAEGPDTTLNPTGLKSGITKGPLYRLRRVDVKDENGMALPGIPVHEWSGEPARAVSIEALRFALQNKLAVNGFVFAEITATVRPDPWGEPAVDLGLLVVRGPAFKLGEPMVGMVRGTRTRPDVVTRLALWEAGENFDPARVEKGLARLRRLGYYESVDQTGLFRDPERNVLYPVLRLPDAHVNTIGGLLGYDSEAESGTRLTGFLDIKLVNLRGTARDLEFSFDGRTGRDREARASYTEPWILGLPVGVRWEGRFLQQDTVFREWEHTAVVFRELGFTSRIEAAFGAQANRDLVAQTGSSALTSGVSVVHDSRDRAPFTRRGLRTRVGITGLRRTLDGGGSGASSGDSSYYLAQVEAGLEHWQPLTERAGLKFGMTAATNAPLNRLDRGELFDVGGARSLRGYREREFQTNAFALGDLELQYAVGRRGRLFGFASPGLVNRPVGRYQARRVLGYGAGLEVARADWSVSITYALNPERTFGDGLLHAAVENRF